MTALVESRAEGEVDRLVHDRFFSTINQPGVCVEVGAARPDFLSIGKFYRSRGWRVISIEPNPEFCELHRIQGNEIYEYACGERDRDDAEFFVVDSHGSNYEGGTVSYESFSSLGIRDQYADLAQGLDLGIHRIPVKVRRLDTILKLHAPELKQIDLLAIDVEGWELDVLRGLDISRHRPRVMIVENLFDRQEYRDYLQRAGYTIWRTLPPNEVYVADTRLRSRARRFIRTLVH